MCSHRRRLCERNENIQLDARHLGHKSDLSIVENTARINHLLLGAAQITVCRLNNNFILLHTLHMCNKSRNTEREMIYGQNPFWCCTHTKMVTNALRRRFWAASARALLCVLFVRRRFVNNYRPWCGSRRVFLWWRDIIRNRCARRRAACPSNYQKLPSGVSVSAENDALFEV